MIDDWTVRANAHRLLESAWIGTTTFREADDFIDDDSDEEPMKDEDEDEDPIKESTLTARESPSGGTVVEQKKEVATEYFDLSPTKTTSEVAQPGEINSTAPKTTASASCNRVPLNSLESSSGKRRAPMTSSDVVFRLSDSLQGQQSEGECMTHTTDSLVSFGLTDCRKVGQRQVRCVSRAARSAAPRPLDAVTISRISGESRPAPLSLKLRDL